MSERPHRPCPPPSFLPAALVAGARRLQLTKGERLFSLGDEVHHLYFIQSGELKAIRPQIDGSQAVMLRARAGEFFAESALAVPHYVCDAEAVAPTLLLAFPAGEFRSTLQQERDVALSFALALAAHARRQCSRVERLRLKRARDRVLHLLTCEGDAQGVLNWQSTLIEMAEELGLEPETLYRALNNLEKAGLIERERRRLRLVRPGP